MCNPSTELKVVPQFNSPGSEFPLLIFLGTTWCKSWTAILILPRISFPFYEMSSLLKLPYVRRFLEVKRSFDFQEPRVLLAWSCQRQNTVQDWMNEARQNLTFADEWHYITRSPFLRIFYQTKSWPLLNQIWNAITLFIFKPIINFLLF